MNERTNDHSILLLGTLLGFPKKIDNITKKKRCWFMILKNPVKNCKELVEKEAVSYSH